MSSSSGHYEPTPNSLRGAENDTNRETKKRERERQTERRRAGETSSSSCAKFAASLTDVEDGTKGAATVLIATHTQRDQMHVVHLVLSSVFQADTNEDGGGETDGKTESETERDKDRQTERETERDRERQRKTATVSCGLGRTVEPRVPRPGRQKTMRAWW